MKAGDWVTDDDGTPGVVLRVELRATGDGHTQEDVYVDWLPQDLEPLPNYPGMR